jgi:glyoxylase-like metal-dependent hydrolase (beta-lactamase superfamily II)
MPGNRRGASQPIRFVFVTYYHGDHSYGNSIFVDAGTSIICSEACTEELRTKGESGWRNWKDAAHPLTGARPEQATITFGDRMVWDDGAQRV